MAGKMHLLILALLQPCIWGQELVKAKDPLPKEIEELVCRLASDKYIEDGVVEGICSEIHNLFPGLKFDPDCKTVVQSVWEAGLALCPTSSGLALKPALKKAAAPLAGAFPLPIPEFLQRIICSIASDKDIEDGAVDAVCGEIKQLFPDLKLEPDCKTVVDAIYETGLASCPKGQEKLSMRKSLEKGMCEFEKDLGDVAVGAVCEKLAPQFKSGAQCKAVVEAIWKAGLASCPQRQTVTAPNDSPVPKEIIELVCRIASDKTIEDAAVGGICSEIHNLFPGLKFDPDCKTTVDAVWEAGLALCPSTQESIVV